MNFVIFGALFTLRLSALNSQFKEGAKYVNAYLRTPITSGIHWRLD